MIIDTTNVFNSPVRNISARVELYKGSALADTFTPSYGIKNFSIERVGEESKFFGFGICQEIKLELVDKDRLINIEKANTLKPYINAGGNDINSFPSFTVEEVKRDENTNELTITAYDALYAAAAHTVAELGLVAPYTIQTVAEACAVLLGVNLFVIAPEGDTSFSLSFPTGANFEGTETIRQALNAIAEATQTIFYIDGNDILTFKRLDIAGEPVLIIDKANYFTLNSKQPQTITSIVSATELGDNVSTGDSSGAVQYVRDNPFWDIREDIGTLVDAALARINGLTIYPFSCSWRGNTCVEIGDKIGLITKDDNVINSYMLSDSVEYSGGLSQETNWTYEASAETPSNPSTLGAAIKQTYARVDKANQQIELVAGETAEIRLTTDTISSSVVKLDNDMTEVMAEVNSKMSADEVNLSITAALEEGVNRVITTTGFTFNEEGLHITKTNSEITTSITEDGMTVYRKDSSVLVADNQGVKAEDLHAATFLIIGNNSRLEDYNSNRTGCFWIGN